MFETADTPPVRPDFTNGDSRVEGFADDPHLSFTPEYDPDAEEVTSGEEPLCMQSIDAQDTGMSAFGYDSDGADAQAYETATPPEEIAAPEEIQETSIWYGGTGMRLSEVDLVRRAISNIGGLTMRVVDDPAEARGIVSDMRAESLRSMYPDASEQSIKESAESAADGFVRDMQPTPANNQDPLRLIRIESADQSPVEPWVIAEEIKFRVKPGLSQGPITVDEVLHAAIRPVDPHTLLG
ncbi:MAG TPA: hypothetical protein VF809_00565 [Candidatus Saccharimonadales bacterium]